MGDKNLILFIFIMTGFTAGAQIAKLGFDAINTGCSRSGGIEGTGMGLDYMNVLWAPSRMAKKFICWWTAAGCL